jgi:hypothetical protein
VIAVLAVPPLATILLLASTLMPPMMTPLSKMFPPLRKAPLMIEMPPEPIVPALVTPPLKVVWLITIAVVLPLNLVGYGPLNGIWPPATYRDGVQRHAAKSIRNAPGMSLIEAITLVQARSSYCF